MKRQKFPFLISPYAKTTARSPHSERDLQRLAETVQSMERLVHALPGTINGEHRVEDETRDGAPGEAFFKQLVPVLDGLESLRTAIAQAGDEAWREGIDMFFEKLVCLLADHGFRPTARVGDSFDPSFHEAVGSDKQSELPPGRVSRVVQSGWTLGDRTLRYARVLVSRRAQES